MLKQKLGLPFSHPCVAVIAIVREPIDTQQVLDSVQSTQAGAAVLFLGTTRELTAGRRTLWLDYECYEGMAVKELEKLEQEARRRWSLEHCTIVHRLGRVDLGEASVAVAVSTAHRQASFEAGQWLIDQLKELAPIWKQEHWDSGESEWVHPGGAGGETHQQPMQAREGEAEAK